MTTRTAINLNSPLVLYHRHRDRIEDALVALGLALLVSTFLGAVGVLSEGWRTVLVLVLLVVGTVSRFWGYNAAVAVLVWPIWTLSPFLALVFLAGTLLPRRWMVEAMPWVLLVASAPLLAQWQIVGVAPLLAGLVAGRFTAFGIGALTALWLTVAGGLAGWQPELGALHGAVLSPETVDAHFAGVPVLRTFGLMVAPFAESPLLHASQVLVWGGAGWLVAAVRRMKWQDGTPQLPLVPALATGVLVLWTALFLLPVWFDGQAFWVLLAAPTPTVGLALSAILAALLGGLLESVRRPVARARRASTTPRPKRRMGREGMRPAVEETRRVTARRHPWAEIPQPDDEDATTLDVR